MWLLEKKSNRDELDDKVYSLLPQKVEYIKNHKPHKLDLEDEKIILLHGDFNSENVFFDISTNIINVFDFDRVFVGYALYELISSLVIMFFDNFKERNFDKASKFLSGYKSVKHINRHSFKRTIQYFIDELFYTSLFEEEKYLRKSDRFDNVYKHYLSTLKYFLQKNDFTERISNYS
jgi:Ser/Thr protein kinase RdoA (MazF antagonist)